MKNKEMYFYGLMNISTGKLAGIDYSSGYPYYPTNPVPGQLKFFHFHDRKHADEFVKICSDLKVVKVRLIVED